MARIFKKRHKYNAKTCFVIDGHLFIDDNIMRQYLTCNPCADIIKFDSKREALRYLELLQLQKNGVISDLQLQPSYEVVITKKYRADFYYKTPATEVVEDVKGFKTKEYITKRKFFKKQYPHLLHLES